MFWEFSSLSWLAAALVFIGGGVLGYIIARQIKDQRTRQLEQELDAARQELGSYRQDVNRHFLKTSLLFNKLTDDYREVYQHLASGAQKLCAEGDSSLKASFPQQDILPGIASPATTATSTDIRSNPASDKASTDVATEAEAVPQATAGEEALQAREEETGQAVDEEASMRAARRQQSAEQSLKVDDDVHLGEESAPAIDLEPDLAEPGGKPSIH